MINNAIKMILQRVKRAACVCACFLIFLPLAPAYSDMTTDFVNAVNSAEKTYRQTIADIMKSAGAEDKLPGGWMTVAGVKSTATSANSAEPTKTLKNTVTTTENTDALCTGKSDGFHRFNNTNLVCENGKLANREPTDKEIKDERCRTNAGQTIPAGKFVKMGTEWQKCDGDNWERAATKEEVCAILVGEYERKSMNCPEIAPKTKASDNKESNGVDDNSSKFRKLAETECFAIGGEAYSPGLMMAAQPFECHMPLSLTKTQLEQKCNELNNKICGKFGIGITMEAKYNESQRTSSGYIGSFTEQKVNLCEFFPGDNNCATSSIANKSESVTIQNSARQSTINQSNQPPKPSGTSHSPEISLYAPNQKYNGYDVDYYEGEGWLERAQQYAMGILVKKQNRQSASDSARTLKIYGMCSDEDGPYSGAYYLESNKEPSYSKTGEKCWCSFNIDGKNSRWGFYENKKSAEKCFTNCASSCAMNVHIITKLFETIK